METLKTAGLIAGVLLLTCGAVRADDYDWDDILAPYRQRIDTATTSSGNAQNVNAATQVITPWPPYVRNRRIPGDGARMVGAIERYHDPHGKGGGAPQQPTAYNSNFTSTTTMNESSATTKSSGQTSTGKLPGQ